MDRVHVGTMGWSYSFWRGSFYPKEMKPSGFLSEYSKHFETVEVDNTFYRVPSVESIENWKRQTPEGFLFSAKFPQTITHRKMLRDCEQDVQFFLERMSAFESKLGLLLLQLPPAFGIVRFDVLREFLNLLPRRFRFAVEVRNAELLGTTLFALLRENGVGLAIVSSPFLPKVEELTADFVYVRWEGDRKKVNGELGKVEVDRTIDTRRWAGKIMGFLEKTDQVFGYFSKYYSGNPTVDAKQLVDFLS